MALQRVSRITAAERARNRGQFAAVLAARRQELGLSQAELADLAGVSRTPIIAVEAGRSISLDVLLSVVQVLGLHLELTRGATPTEVQVSSELTAQYSLNDEMDGRNE